MNRFASPSIDIDNPLYCPAIPAASYIKSLQDRGRRTSSKSNIQLRRKKRLVASFAQVLHNSLLVDTGDSSDYENHENTISRRHLTGNQPSPTDSFTSSDEDSPLLNSIPRWERGNRQDTWDHGYFALKKRKRDSFSDIYGPPRYAKSILSAHDSSFDVSLKRQRLSYLHHPGSPVKGAPSEGQRNVDAVSMLTLRVRDLEGTIAHKIFDEKAKHRYPERLFGLPIGTESNRDLHAFIETLDNMLPGVRLKERLFRLPIISHQSIIDFLGTNGYLSSRILAVFRGSEVCWITLTESLIDPGGLNLSRDILPTFNQPNSFLFVTELSIRDVSIDDFELKHIHHLPRLATLLLDNTSISNEAVFLLLPLKHTLTQLSIGSNPAIDDDAMPAISRLSKLAFLSILDTGIHMSGLRRLARTIHNERVINIEIPSSCMDYIKELDKKYEINPRPPLTEQPKVCARLSAAALQRNLAAHKARNPGIIVTGGKAEMAERLRSILEMRRMDLLVRDMILCVRDRFKEEEEEEEENDS